MAKSFAEWLSEGESIYAESLQEYQALEAQIASLETRLAEKKAELNQIAQMIGKPLVENPNRLTAQLVEHDTLPAGTVTRALTGRGILAR